MVTFDCKEGDCDVAMCNSIGGLVVEYIVAIDVTRVRFPADALSLLAGLAQETDHTCVRRWSIEVVCVFAAVHVCVPRARWWSPRMLNVFAAHYTHQHRWSSGRIHRCHRCDPGSIPGRCIVSARMMGGIGDTPLTRAEGS